MTLNFYDTKLKQIYLMVGIISIIISSGIYMFKDFSAESDNEDDIVPKIEDALSFNDGGLADYFDGTLMDGEFNF